MAPAGLNFLDAQKSEQIRPLSSLPLRKGKFLSLPLLPFPPLPFQSSPFPFIPFLFPPSIPFRSFSCLPFPCIFHFLSRLLTYLWLRPPFP